MRRPGLAIAILACAWTLCAQPPLDSVVDALAAVHRFHNVTISADGRRIAWVESVHAPSGEAVNATALFTLDLSQPGARAQRVSPRGAAAAHESAPVWSPDGAELIFLSDAARGGQPQLYLWRGGGGARRLTSLDGVLAAPAWSPDGKTVSFLFTSGASGQLGPLEATPAQTGVIEETVHNQRLMLLDLAGGSPRAASPDNLHIYEYAWSPDGRRFAATAAPGPGDNNWWTAQLYTLQRDASTMRPIYRPPVTTQLAGPQWSPTGDRIAFIGGLMSDEGVTGGDVFVIPAAGGEARNLTAHRAASPSSVQWTAENTLLVTEWFGGGSRIARLDASSGQAEVLWTGDEDCHGGGYGPTFSLSRDGAASVFARASFSAPPEIWAGAVGGWRQVTRLNTGARPAWGQAKSIAWTNDGFRVQGWLIYPRDYSPTRRYPMVVEVHGGPASSVRAGWPRVFYNMVPLASAGYFIFLPNPRGSYGQGEAFTRANINDFGGGDLRDILAGVDEVLRTAPVDPARIGITGWSYGGFMTMFAVTQTNRFRAAVSGAGISNWQSYYGENSIDQWMIPFFGASVYDAPANYARASAINFIKQVKTPTLVVVGERDAECPAPQSFEFWHALKTLGVRTTLVVYPGEGHSFRKPEHRRDVARRAFSWFEQYLR